VDPAVQGSLEAMRAAQKCNIKKIVVTSSMVSVTDEPGKLFTEADWNEKSSLKRNPYAFSKTQAEKACWDFIKQHPDNSPELVTILVRLLLSRHP
jgi:dihydroflavonol-4-reductase